jgi:tryptophanyl-tRNA synthetase
MSLRAPDAKMSKSDPHDGSRINLTGTSSVYLVEKQNRPPFYVFIYTLPQLMMTATHNGMLWLSDMPDEIRGKIRKAVTDSEAGIIYDRDRRPGVANLVDIAAAMLGACAVLLSWMFWLFFLGVQESQGERP